MHKATLFKKLKGSNTKCTACNHYCSISPDNVGICGVRQNRSGELYSLVYGQAVAANTDPIEKKPLFHFLPDTEIFSVGTIGCNFGCEFCQNWDISQASKTFRREFAKKGNLSELDLEVEKYGFKLPPEKIVKHCRVKKIPSIAYTYNEPAIFFEYTYDTARLAHDQGIKNVYVSNGYASKEAVEMISPYLDGINIDLKAFTEDFYKETCKARLAPVLENIVRYFEAGVWVELTTLVIPAKNDSSKELQQIAEFIASVSKSIPWHVTRFTPAYKMRNGDTTSSEILQRAHNIGKDAGLKYVYVGNVLDQDLHSTYCPKCKEIVIKRDWNFTEIVNLKDGKCSSCDEVIEGVWK